MCELCSKSRYGYHITRREHLDAIRREGLKSLVLRTTSWTAAETGSFAADRREQRPGKISGKLKDAVARCLKAGLSEQQILDSPRPTLLVLIDVPLTGSIDDNTQVDEEFAESIATYVSMVKPDSPPGSPGIPKTKGFSFPAKTAPVSKEMVGRIVERIATNENHYLCRLAESYTDWRFAIEEKITGSHVYFFVSNHKSKYLQYLRFSGGEEGAVILRISLANLHGHERDMSDAFAVMTSGIVLAMYLEFCLPAEAFNKPMGFEEAAGSNIKIWEGIGEWTPLVG